MACRIKKGTDYWAVHTNYTFQEEYMLAYAAYLTPLSGCLPGVSAAPYSRQSGPGRPPPNCCGRPSYHLRPPARFFIIPLNEPARRFKRSLPTQYTSSTLSVAHRGLISHSTPWLSRSCRKPCDKYTICRFSSKVAPLAIFLRAMMAKASRASSTR